MAEYDKLEMIEKIVNEKVDKNMIAEILDDMSQDFRIVEELNNIFCLAMEIIRLHDKDVSIKDQRTKLLELVDNYTLEEQQE